VQMPGIDGFETCRRLKKNPATQSIPVIFTTALSDLESKAKGFSVGAVDYIPKPFDQTEVLARLQVHLQLKQLQESLEDQVRDRTLALQQAQIQLVQQEKLSTLGELVSGIGHEINNPLGCIASNLVPAKQYLADMVQLLAAYQKHYPKPVDAVAEIIEEIDLDFILEDFTKLLDSMTVASNRMKDISNSLRIVARADGKEATLADLHEGLESTLLLLQHRLKATRKHPAIEIVKQYSRISPILCYPGQINQVFMNILANAIDMFEEMLQNQPAEYLQSEPQKIIIRTEQVMDQIVIRIRDNGKGMSKEVQAKVFDHLFTTKVIGKGTGLGLAIARQIIEEKHGGRLEVQSEVGQGTEFVIRLPLQD
jgi:signal transduction histidine kinase